MTDVQWNQTRFPKSKRKRIRKKWAKNPQNGIQIVKPSTNIYYSKPGNFIMGHPDIINGILHELIAKQMTEEIELSLLRKINQRDDSVFYQ